MRYNIPLVVPLVGFLTFTIPTVLANPTRELSDLKVSSTPISSLGMHARDEPISNPSINCDGSIHCHLKSAVVPRLLAQLRDFRDGPLQSPWRDSHEVALNDGQQIACSRKGFLWGYYFCAFFEGRNGTLTEAIDLLQNLADHGCKHCGSAPNATEGSNTSGGVLKVDYVSNGCNDGWSNDNSLDMWGVGMDWVCEDIVYPSG